MSRSSETQLQVGENLSNLELWGLKGIKVMSAQLLPVLKKHIYIYIDL